MWYCVNGLLPDGVAVDAEGIEMLSAGAMSLIFECNSLAGLYEGLYLVVADLSFQQRLEATLIVANRPDHSRPNIGRCFKRRTWVSGIAGRFSIVEMRS